MDTTQQHLPISDIKDDLVLLKDGGAALVLQVGAVNFGLLSEREQVSIIAAFAQMLNSLSFSIQILIHSERLNISSYIERLEVAQKMQNNFLLANMMGKYRAFIQKIVKDNDVLDKKFYVVIPSFGIEMGLGSSGDAAFKKAKTLLIPRRDQVIRQLNRTGLRSNQLTTKELIVLFHNLYNYSPNQVMLTKPTTQQLHVEQVQLKNPAPQQEVQPPISPQQPSIPQASAPAGTPPMQQPIRDSYQNTNRHAPFVVEELAE